MSDIIIYEEPLSDEEYQKHSVDGSIRKAPSRYHIIDCLKELRYSRPAKTQRQLNQFISFLELDPDLGLPFSPEIVNGVWDKNK